MSNSPLSIYLNDHLAMMTSENELALRCSDNNEDSSLGEYLKQYANEQAEQANVIRQMIVAADAEESSFKQAVGWLAEKAGRLKPNGGGSSYTQLARLLELEGLLFFANARLTMWKTLEGVDFGVEESAESARTAQQQTQQQISILQEHHQQAARIALAASPTTTG